MTIKPLADRVVIKAVEAEEKTKGGLILTASAQEKPQVAEVVAVGPGGLVDGKEVVCHVKNTGRCREILKKDAVVFLEKSNNLVHLIISFLFYVYIFLK